MATERSPSSVLVLLTVCLFVFLLFPGLETLCAEETLVVRVPPTVDPEDPRDIYPRALLRLALDRTRQTHGDFEIHEVEHAMNQKRALWFLKNNQVIDSYWSMTTRQREQDLRPIRIPLRKGLIGYRLLLVRESDTPEFRPHTRNQLGEMKAGQLKTWPDFEVLRRNNLPVEAATHYPGIFRMLRHRRFDYLPRGIIEIWNEIEEYQLNDLSVAPATAIFYPSATYFFVSKKNTQLAQRIKIGLEKAVKDGGFDRLFDKHIGPSLKQTNLSQRRAILLDNPFLPETIPFGNKNLWHPEINDLLKHYPGPDVSLNPTPISSPGGVDSR